jgi:hypothetical protein
MNIGIGVVVIVVFVVIWILTTVVRAQQEAVQAAARRPANRPVGASAPLPSQRGGSDIDRFLQEIDRLRKKGQQDKSADAKPSPPRSDSGRGDAQRGARSQPPLKKPSSERKKPVPGERRTSSGRLGPPAPPPVVEPMEPSAPAQPSEPAPVRSEQAVPDVQRQARISAPSRPSRPAQAGAAISPALQMLETLFKTKEGVGVAVLLHEILSPPKCRRKPGSYLTGPSVE